MLGVMFNIRGCNSLTTHNKVVGCKVMVVGSSMVVVVGVMVVNVGDLNVVNLLPTILRIFLHHLLFLHQFLHWHQLLMRSKTM